RKDQAEIIREASRRFLAGESCYTIAQDFNRRGVPPARGGEWNMTRIRRIMTNPAYIAKRVHQGQIVRDAEWPPILDERTFHQCVAKANDPSRQKSSAYHVKFLLTGLMRCG